MLKRGDISQVDKDVEFAKKLLHSSGKSIKAAKDNIEMKHE